MPEGPSIVILREQMKPFTGKKITSVSGNSKIDQTRLQDQKVIAFRSWGKHFLICFKTFNLRIHFLLFGSYLINEEKEQTPRLSLSFPNGSLNLYSCSVQFIEGEINEIYDFSTDVMSEEWDPSNALKTIKKKPNQLVCDILLEQDIFSGVGNIIKNEVLYRIKVHPESSIQKIPLPKIKAMIKEARIYSFEFLEWKKKYELKKHWLAHTKTICQRCDLPIIKKYTGVKKRRSFFCTNCQTLYI